jgi:hypothetical protein
MKVAIRAASFAIAAVVAVWFAVHAAAYLERDNCLDAGGRYLAETGLCETGGVAYVALFSRPHVYASWAGLLGAAFVAGWLVWWIATTALGAKRSRD